MTTFSDRASASVTVTSSVGHAVAVEDDAVADRDCAGVSEDGRWFNDARINAAPMVMILKMEPGSYCALMAGLRKRSIGSSSKRLGSKSGRLTMPSMAPVLAP